jgi:hypothetical protein
MPEPLNQRDPSAQYKQTRWHKTQIRSRSEDCHILSERYKIYIGILKSLASTREIHLGQHTVLPQCALIWNTLPVSWIIFIHIM